MSATDTAPRVTPRTATPRPGASDGYVERLLLLVGVVIALASVACASATLDGGASSAPSARALRVVVEVLAVCALPGIPLVVLLRPASRALGAALATASSTAVTVLVAQAALVTGVWHPVDAQIALDVASLVLTAVAWRRCPRPQGERSTAVVTLDVLVAAGRAVSSRAVALGAVALALVLFVVQCRVLDVRAAGQLGIITQVGWTYVAALALIAGATAWGLRRPSPDHLLLVVAWTALLVVATTLVSASEGATSIPTGWVHRSFIDMITAAGALPPPFDARIDWAGFFAAGAQVVEVAGVPDATPLLSPAPVVLDVMALPALYVIGRAITGRARTAWIGLVLYLLADWYDQDYFAPQGLALVWSLAILAVLLWWWRAVPRSVQRSSLPRRLWRTPWRIPPRPPRTGPVRALVVEAVLLVIMAAVVVTHQLTPVTLIPSLLAFSLVGGTRFRTLWIAGTLMFVAWFSFGAYSFWSGHFAEVFGDVGQVSNTLQGGVAAHVGVQPEHQKGQYLRLGTSGALAATAAVGWVLRWPRRGQLLVGLLAAIPFGLVAVQSYGGEVVIRCFVLASPVLAPLAADALVRCARLARRALGRWSGAQGRAAAGARRAGPAVVALLVLVGSLVLTTNRGLNTAFERTSAQEVRVGDALLADVPTGTTIMTWASAPALTSARTLKQVTISLPTTRDGRAPCVTGIAACTVRSSPDYVFLTPTQEASGVLQSGQSPGWLTRAEKQLLATGKYVVVLRDRDVTLLRRSDVTVPAGVQ